MSAHWLLWGKLETSDDGSISSWHPLLLHMLDVAFVAQALLLDALPGGILARFAKVLRVADDDVASALSFWVALHDLGKATPAFQRKGAGVVARLRAEGFDFPHKANAQPHGTMTVDSVSDLLAQGGMPKAAAGAIARAVGAHHGIFPSDSTIVKDVSRNDRGGSRWTSARAAIVEELAATLAPPGLSGANWQAFSREHELSLLLAGLTSVADWIGSSRSYFPYAPDCNETATYMTEAADRARHAIDGIGWRRPSPPAAAVRFRDIFARSPWPLHEAAETLAERLEEPTLVVIEAPMGEGKTEAALYLARGLSRSENLCGLYVALPTQATSNQMLGRIEAFLDRSVRSGERANLHLLHGNAALQPAYERLRLASVQADGAGADLPEIVAEEWFARSKRGLLATFGVGTIDQALMGVLRVKHGFVRLFGLSCKVVILDEVHAYDAYTSTLIERLLAWLRALGCSVILLSATLPRDRRSRLLSAYTGCDIEASETIYPRITWVDGGRADACEVNTHAESKTLSVSWLGPDLAEVAHQVAAEVVRGGCVAWIANSVGRAQQVFRRLLELRVNGVMPSETALALLHSRFPFEDREVRERAALDRFGPRRGDGRDRRPASAVLVGTQVLEQSLDLDFDLMVTDLAPVDLVLQRAGRLHRHEGRTRPVGMTLPRLWIVRPPGCERSEGPDFRATAAVYEEAIMLRSWLVLHGCDAITIPDAIESLIEAVYGDDSVETLGVEIPLRDRLNAAAKKFKETLWEQESKAKLRLLANPNAKDDPFAAFDTVFAEDDDDVHASLRALTRLGAPSVDVVCLLDGPVGPSLESDGSEPVDLDMEPDRETTKRLLRRSLRIAHRSVYGALMKQPVPAGWARTPALSRHRLIVFGGGVANVDGTTLRLDPDLGLVIGDS